MHPSPSPSIPTHHPRPITRILAGSAILAVVTLPAAAQNQSLAFTGGVLLNTRVSFRGLGNHTPSSQPGPEAGGAINRSYDNGYIRVDDSGNAGDTTVHYGYRSTSQIGVQGLTLSSVSTYDPVTAEDRGAFLEPSANLEYRGSLGTWGNADWGVLLGVGYQAINQDLSGTFITSASVIEDHFALGNVGRDEMPPAPFEGSASSDVPRISSVPSRNFRSVPNARVLDGRWDFGAELIPVTGGLYLEFQLAGRLNGVASAGMFAAFVNADLSFRETSTVGGLPPVTESNSNDVSDFILGGFTQFGIDWALWENASIVASARWQPAQTFRHSVQGRSVELDFSSAFAVHAGFALRF